MMNSDFLSVLYLCLLATQVFANNNLAICDDQDICSNQVAMSCEELLGTHDLQGSCCSLEDIPATGHCRVRVGGNGNCYWYPKCNVRCPQKNEADWTITKCGIEFRDFSGKACPDSEYPTNWKTGEPTYSPTSSHSPTAVGGTRPPTWEQDDYSCAPTTGPATVTPNTPSGADSTLSSSSTVFKTTMLVATIATILT